MADVRILQTKHASKELTSKEMKLERLNRKTNCKEIIINIKGFFILLVRREKKGRGCSIAKR